MADTSETDTLKQDVAQLRSDLAALTDDFKKRANEQTHAGMDRARGQTRNLAQEGEKYARQSREEIEAHPFASILAGFGVGLLIGKILSR